jgi:RNA polymerase sigma-70 factor (ECF subfamily)
MGDDVADQVLVARVQAGDRAAFDLLVLRYQHRIVKLIGRYVRDHADALDVAQDAFIRAYRAMPGFRGDSAFYTWMYRIAINTAKNHLASLARRTSEASVDIDDAVLFDSDIALRDTATPERLAMRDQVHEAIVEALAQLPDDLRTAITLRELEGMSYEEIAAVMECPIGTVRSRIFRAREAINQRVDPLLERG